MNILTFNVMNDSLEFSYTNEDQPAATRQFMLRYNPKQSIGRNLDNIKGKLMGLKPDAAIINNALEYPFSDTVVSINYQRIDIGLALTNMLNIPAVSRHAIDKEGLQTAVNKKRDYLEWHLDYYGQYDQKRNYGQEAMLTVGNGFFGLRGAYVESKADADNYPGMYVAGVYDQQTTNINGRDVTNEDLVNFPNAQYLSFGVDHQTPFTISRSDISDIYRSLDLHTGAQTTTMIIKLPTGHLMSVKTTKIANMVDWHRYAIKYEVTPMNFTGSVQIYSEIDGSVVNSNVDRYNDFDQHHLDITSMSSYGNRVYLDGQTRQSEVQFVIGSEIGGPALDQATPTEVTNDQQEIHQVASIDVQPGQTYTFEKNVVIFTDRETDGNLDLAADKEMDRASFNNTLASSTRYWNTTWKNVDIRISGDTTSQKLTRVNLYHLFVSSAAIESGQIDASIGARGLHGEAYRGHIFWDEMFDIPFYALHYPELAKQLLLYRYRRLGAARQNASDDGHTGAMYPWQSGTKGDEQSQLVHLNPLTKTWDPDNSRLQRHVSLAVAYNVITYTRVTGDEQFMDDYGLEMLQSIADYWISKAKRDNADGRYTIDGVMGPDEFHEGYPNSANGGLVNNAYTNIMVTWLFNQISTIRQTRAADVLKTIDAKSSFDNSRLTTMTQIAHKLKLDISHDGVIGQFEGYFNLERLDFDQYRQKYGDISRMDRILKAEGKSPDSYQVAKQADALMPFYSLDLPQVTAILTQLGYKVPDDALATNLRYYLARTTHGSTLSRIVYSVLTEMANDMDTSWHLFSEALFSDYFDIQGGTTAEGIHLGVMGAVTLIETRNYAGVDAFGDKLTITPHLPAAWQQIHFTQVIKGITYKFTINHKAIRVTADQNATVWVANKDHQLKKNEELSIKY